MSGSVSQTYGLDCGVFGTPQGGCAFTHGKFAARPVPAKDGSFMAILFGPETVLADSDLEMLYKDVHENQVNGSVPVSDARMEKIAKCFCGTVVQYAVNPTVTRGYSPVSQTATEEWSFISDLVPSGSTPKDFYSLLFNYGHRMNEVRDKVLAGSSVDETELMKRGSFEILFYACSSGGPLSA